MRVWQEMLDPSLLLQLPQNPPDNKQPVEPDLSWTVVTSPVQLVL